MDGFHLMLKLIEVPPETSSDLNLVSNILMELPGLVGMTIIAPPYVFKYSGLKPEDHGITGFVVLAESHCSIHTFVDHNLIWLDIFSCKPFDHLWVADYLQKAFKAIQVEPIFIER